MAGKRIDSILVKEAIEKELQFLAGNLDELAAKIKTFPAIRTKTEGANNVKELSKAQIQYAESLKAVEQLVKQRMASEAKLITLQSDYAVATAKNRTEVQKMNREQKIAAEIALSQEGSIERARAKIKALTLEQSKLNLVTAEGRKRNDEINKSLDKYTEFIRKNVSAAEKQRMNVGNYQGSAKIIVDAMERARQKVVQVEKDFGKMGPEARAARGEFEALRQITQDNRFLNIAAKVGDTNKELRFFTQQLNALEDAGMKNSQVYADVRKRLAELTDQIADTKAEVKALSSDTRSFDLFAGSVNFAADALQTYAGTAVLFGASEEEVANQIKTLVAVQSVANGVKGIANELTTKGTAANKAYAFVQNLVALSMDKTAASSVRLNAALGLIAIAATVIGAIAIAFAAASKDADKMTEKVDNLNSVLSDSQSTYVESVKLVAELKANINLAKEGFISKKDVVKQYNDTIGETTGKVKSLDEAEKEIVKNADAYIQFTLLKAAANKAFEKSAEKLFDYEADLRTSAGFTESIGKQTTANLSYEQKEQQKINDRATKGFADAYKGRAEDAKKGSERLQSIGEDLLKKSAELAKKFKFDFSGNGDKSNNKETDAAKVRLDALQLQYEREAALQKQIVEIESFSLSERLQASREYVALKTKIIDAEYQYEINKKGATADEIKASEIKRLQAISALADESRQMFKANINAATQEISDGLGDVPDEVTAVMDKMNAELAAGFKKWSKELNGNLTDQQKEIIEQTKNNYIDAFQTIADAAGEVVGGIFDKQKNAIQDQIDDIDRLKAAEIDRINASGDGEEKKAARIKIIEAKAQADREALARRQREIDRQRAIAERAFKLFQITTDTIQAVNKIKQLIAAAPDPFSKGLYISQLVMAIASGAASVTSLLATPIPKFAKGKTSNDPYEGPGIAGEAGRELFVSKTGQLSMIEKPTLLNLRKGDTILPNRVTEDMVRAAHNDRLQLMNLFTGGQAVSDMSKLEEKTDIMVNELKKISGKPPIIIQNNPAVETSVWFFNTFKN